MNDKQAEARPWLQDENRPAADAPAPPPDGRHGAAPDNGTDPGTDTGTRAGVRAAVQDDAEVAELRDRWQRAVAETENLRKRCARQLEDVRQSERDRVTAAWLPVLDHLELALQHADADPKSVLAGVEAVCQQAFGVLAQLGYRRIAETGEPFDPSRHEAAQVLDEPDATPGSVLRVLRPGYDREGGLLRPAMVSVANRSQE
ncbi:nucleotide exchange factor GrpE [Streptomyces sp. NPDC046866]|uniref:nucleotide exchange factor GrpE n=1 Tax=Streptomyces sp. NPDC046866 TaxID=3154921 RepID=UPI003454F45A